MGKLKDFIDGSKYCQGISMDGCYGMGSDNFESAYEHFLKTGENVLDEHAKLTWLGWNVAKGFDDIGMHSEIKSMIMEVNHLKSVIDNTGFWNVKSFFSDEELNKIIRYVSYIEGKIEFEKTYKRRRYVASIYTTRSDIRKKIFDRDGRVCKHCQTTKNLTLDHIIPVSKNGKDNLCNLQVLCKSCNSKKSNKSI